MELSHLCIEVRILRAQFCSFCSQSSILFVHLGTFLCTQAQLLSKQPLNFVSIVLTYANVCTQIANLTEQHFFGVFFPGLRTFDLNFIWTCD